MTDRTSLGRPGPAATAPVDFPPPRRVPGRPDPGGPAGRVLPEPRNEPPATRGGRRPHLFRVGPGPAGLVGRAGAPSSLPSHRLGRSSESGGPPAHPSPPPRRPFPHFLRPFIGPSPQPATDRRLRRRVDHGPTRNCDSMPVLGSQSRSAPAPAVTRHSPGQATVGREACVGVVCAIFACVLYCECRTPDHAALL